MHLATPTLMLSFAALSLNSCQTVPTDSFCQLYQQVVTAKGDGTINASPSVKRRLLANEMIYRSQCKPGV